MTSKLAFAARIAVLAAAALLPACAVPSPHSRPSPLASAVADGAVELPAAGTQGALVIGRAPVGSRVEFTGRTISCAPDGRFVLGIARDATGSLPVRIRLPGGATRVLELAITPRDWPVEHIDGVPPATVNPPPAIAARIEAEQARVAAVRLRDDPGLDFLTPFTWPVHGRISGRFGNQRVYNGSAGAPHSGMDIAAATGTPVHAPAGGVVTFADPGLYLTGGTLVLDHGHGVSSNFLHLSRIDARVGQRVEQGEVIGAVGATGRATGPHLHWGMNWFDVRVDPLLVVGPQSPSR
ncbi:M23 family metallopeptidase [Cognatilysobacter lacus]|uniref:M23 family metallopeptidase n=1 Tax=Cognatilysobacter lacus TaxID=1643323 RepID=A0A5D8ZAN1_9GAMM|nr:M23 family metallopeptidase [Lysobacter lacus]TZF91113.1 M23 family metallopeptidase [Lysobacter lacus]